MVFEATDAPVATVSVLAWRLVDELLDCLEGLARSAVRHPFNVSVVLNGAEERVRSAVLEQVEGATVIDSAVNLGFGRAHNLAASQATGEFVVFLNDDVTPEPTWLANLINAAREHPDAGAISGRAHYPDGSLQEAGARILAGPAGMTIGDGAEVLPSELNKPRCVDYGGGGALLVRRELFVELGGFDQEYDPIYFEDVDLCLRLRSAGWNILYEPSAVIVHHRARSLSQESEWQAFAVERAQAVFSKHWGPLLTHAAKPDDPPEVLMPVPAGYGLRHLDLTQQLATDFAPVERQRLIDYSDWLKHRLRSATAELAHLQTAALYTLFGWRVRAWLRGRPRLHSTARALLERRH